MKPSKILLAALSVFFCISLQAQIFINTGNPNIDKYKNENPNAVIWEGGKTVPVPASTPAEQKEQPKKTVKQEPEKETSVVKKEQTKVVEPVKNVEPVATTKPVNTNGAPDFPADGVPGKCYAHCLVPEQYEIKEEQVVDKPASVKIEKIPAKYETVYDTVIVKAASKKSVTTPAQYEIVTENKLVTEATKMWVRGKADKNCLSANPKDCEVWCLKEVPAVYEKVTKKVEKNRAITNEIDVPAITKVVPRKKLVEAARENKIDVPATYKTIMKKVLVKKGGYQEWKEVLCEPLVTDNKVSEIQTALKREGYDPGVIDNQMGGKTKEALIKFQQDKGLPVGNLNLETLKALGVKE